MTSTDQPARAPARIIPAATILLVRDGEAGLEVFMVKRHHQIDFASGALVFPGGKLAPGDSDPRIRGLSDGAEGFDDGALALAACAIREAFEESGILLARKAGADELLTAAEAEALGIHRDALNAETLPLAQFLADHGLRLALDRLVRFARWVTPDMMPKRFDTWFFIAATPEGQLGVHDGHESVDSEWVTPQGALAESDRWTVIFPTRMNLLKLGRSSRVAEALAAAASSPVVTVTPWVEPREGGAVLRIQPDAGYGDPQEPLSNVR
ncbi:MAG: NUDIX domain-containing protein [Alphaproteobacteria bacterium]|nr:NUDIX domain-containing protein [Alphaproteobacteria bacterium]